MSNYKRLQMSELGAGSYGAVSCYEKLGAQTPNRTQEAGGGPPAAVDGPPAADRWLPPTWGYPTYLGFGPDDSAVKEFEAQEEAALPVRGGLVVVGKAAHDKLSAHTRVSFREAAIAASFNFAPLLSLKDMEPLPGGKVCTFFDRWRGESPAARQPARPLLCLTPPRGFPSPAAPIQQSPAPLMFLPAAPPPPCPTGKTLTEYLTKRMGFIRAQGGAPLSAEAVRAWEEEARGMAWDFLLGLHALHAADVVHRDLKPDNILLGPPATDHAPAVSANCAR